MNPLQFELIPLKNHIVIHLNKYIKNSWHITKILKFRFRVYPINRFLFICSLPWIHLLKYCVRSELSELRREPALTRASVLKRLEELDHS